LSPITGNIALLLTESGLYKYVKKYIGGWTVTALISLAGFADPAVAVPSFLASSGLGLATCFGKGVSAGDTVTYSSETNCISTTISMSVLLGDEED
jgi:hypothetical protein